MCRRFMRHIVRNNFSSLIYIIVQMDQMNGAEYLVDQRIHKMMHFYFRIINLLNNVVKNYFYAIYVFDSLLELYF